MLSKHRHIVHNKPWIYVGMNVLKILNIPRDRLALQLKTFIKMNNRMIIVIIRQHLLSINAQRRVVLHSAMLSTTDRFICHCKGRRRRRDIKLVQQRV